MPVLYVINVANNVLAGGRLTQLLSPYPPFSDYFICDKIFSYYRIHLLSNL